MAWACGAYGWGEGVCRVLVGKPEGRRPLGRPRRRWVDNIRMDLQEMGCGYMDWIGLTQDRDRWRTLAIAVMNLRVPWNAGNFLTNCKPVSFSRRTLHHGVNKSALGFLSSVSPSDCYIDFFPPPCPSSPWWARPSSLSMLHDHARVGLLWTNDRPVAETTAWQHSALKRVRHPCPRPLGSAAT